MATLEEMKITLKTILDEAEHYFELLGKVKIYNPATDTDDTVWERD